MVRKIRKIKRVKKKPKIYNFSDDNKILSSNNTYRKSFVLFILIASFICSISSFFTNSTTSR